MKLRILFLALLAILGLPALASAETTQVAFNVPADLLDHALDALISGGLVAIGWAVSHWRIIKRVGSIGEGVGTLLSRLEGKPLPAAETVKKAVVGEAKETAASVDPEAVVKLLFAKISEWDAQAKSLTPASGSMAIAAAAPAQAIAAPAAAAPVVPAAAAPVQA